mmetsp:Transcript_6969/g.9767  ORF Transcript_6969/g.9767 Transcript_6969/m.9767 type:complete len:219 (-) Transcript_6969:820-1476(-)
MRAALIFLHGLGDTSAGWSSLQFSLAPALQKLGLDIEWIFPDAPIAPVSINGGARMTSWFDIFDWPIDIKSRDDSDGILKSVAAIDKLILNLENQGIPTKNIIVGGFSQGGAVALQTVYRSPKKLGGCICLSGWLQLAKEFPKAVSTTPNNQTPLFWGHGSQDPVVVPEQQQYGVSIAQAAGISVTAQTYPMGHASHPQEIADLTSFLHSTWSQCASS